MIRSITNMRILLWPLLILGLLAIVPTASCYKITSLNDTPGILPVKIQNSYVVNDTHAYFHNVNVTKILVELYKIEKLLTKIPDKTKSFIHYDLMMDQLHTIKLKSSHFHLNRMRNRRGLVNGVGTALKWVTGTMDAKDREKYDAMLSKLENNERVLQKNVEKSVSLNKNIIERFNKELVSIENNNDVIKQFFDNYSNSTQHLETVQYYQYIQQVLNVIDNKISDILLSLEFCKLGIIHSTIISYEELKQLIKDTNFHLISEDPSVLWQLGGITCAIHDQAVSYFVQLPLESAPFDTYFLLSYPVKYGNELITTYTHPSLVMKYQKEFLTGDCKLINEKFYCTNTERLNNKCIKNIINNLNTKNCDSVVITHEVKPMTKYIEQINQYLIFSLNGTEINVIGPYENVSLFFKGTNLLYLHNDEDIAEFTKPYTYWLPENLKFDDVPVELKVSEYNFDKIHMANIKIESLDEINVDDTPFDYTGLSIFLFSISFLLITILISLRYIYTLLACK